ncbi:MAG: hypothetical protein OXF86_21245 [Caldilineaceae bacterium]|nr:hypothetical protein [Caldilineaceae bacterium]
MSKNKSVTIEALGSLRQHVAPGTTVQNVQTVGEAVTQLNLPEMGTTNSRRKRAFAFPKSLRNSEDAYVTPCHWLTNLFWGPLFLWNSLTQYRSSKEKLQ